MDSVASILPRVLKKRGMYEHVTASLLCSHAQKWIDSSLPEYAGRLTAQALKNGQLTVSAKDSAALLGLRKRSTELVDALSASIPDSPPVRLLVRRS